MYPSDPQHQYDNYNDATKYRRTGELMEVSFQPLFIEGIPDGSSKRVIKKRDGYPEDKDDTGIAPMYDYITGRVILQINDEDPGKKNERRLALTGEPWMMLLWMVWVEWSENGLIILTFCTFNRCWTPFIRMEVLPEESP
jgi:hypothetical protein